MLDEEIKADWNKTGNAKKDAKAVSYLEALGVYGWSPVERSLMAMLVARRPILLLGGHGLSKTDFTASVAAAMFDDVNFASYNAPLLMPDDLMGILNPGKLKKGEVEYVKTPTSVWGIDVLNIDEITRAQPFVAGKLMEVVQKRTINGRPTGIKMVFATANPPRRTRAASYQAVYLDLALASRFSILDVPSTKELIDAKVFDDIIGMSIDDRGANLLAARKQKGFGLPFRKAVSRARAAMAKWSNRKATQKIIAVTKKLAVKLGEHWSPRQAQDFARLIKASVCLEQVTGTQSTIADYQMMLRSCVPQFCGIVAEQIPLDVDQMTPILQELNFEREFEDVKLFMLLDDKKLQQDPLTLLEVIHDSTSAVTNPAEVFHAACKLWDNVQKKKIDMNEQQADFEVMSLIEYGIGLDNWWEALPALAEVKVDAGITSGDVIALVAESVLDPDSWKD